jgi:hypothetical protein
MEPVPSRKIDTMLYADELSLLAKSDNELRIMAHELNISGYKHKTEISNEIETMEPCAIFDNKISNRY